MNSGKTLFAQLMAWVPWTSFDRIVRRHQGDYGVRTFPCTEQFRAMAFVQLTWRESLRVSPQPGPDGRAAGSLCAPSAHTAG